MVIIAHLWKVVDVHKNRKVSVVAFCCRSALLPGRGRREPGDAHEWSCAVSEIENEPGEVFCGVRHYGLCVMMTTPEEDSELLIAQGGSLASLRIGQPIAYFYVVAGDAKIAV